MVGSEEIQQERSRTFDLKGGKSTGPIEYPGKPIDVFLANQRFQIIEAGPPLFNVPFILADSQTFNPKNPTTGFKGLWEGKEIPFGRNYPYRFQYSPEVSREHLSITVEGNKITIKDLNSTNGSKVIVPIEGGHNPEIKAPNNLGANAVEQKSDLESIKQSIFEKAGNRSVEEIKILISQVEQILAQETATGQGKLGRNIDETRISRNGQEYFVDGKIAYLPSKGDAVFIGDTHGDSQATESIVKQVMFIENMEKGDKSRILVFLGDYADRGKNDVRNLEIVLALKEKYPKNVILLRGNHEEHGVSRDYGLFNSMEQHFSTKGEDIFNKYHELFKHLPNIVITGNGIVAVHGGVPEDQVDNLLTLKNNESLFYQIRWNDPNNYIENIQSSKRGGDIKEFGHEPFEKFMTSIKGKVMIRSHEYPKDGYELFFSNRLVTIYSNGGISRESHYSGRVQPKIMTASLVDPIDKITPQNLFDIKYS